MWRCSARGFRLPWPTSFRNNLAAVRILPKRFAELERNQPYVAFIGITPVAKG